MCKFFYISVRCLRFLGIYHMNVINVKVFRVMAFDSVGIKYHNHISTYRGFIIAHDVHKPVSRTVDILRCQFI